MASRVSALLLLGLICVGFAAAQVVPDCCKDTSPKMFPLQRIESYTIQEAGNGCDISATILKTKMGKKLCVSHPRDKDWVRKHIDVLEKRKERQLRN